MELDESTKLAPVKVTPELALELRTKLLETMVVGSQTVTRHERPGGKGIPLIRDIEEIQRKLDAAVQGSGSDSLRWFVDNYDQYKQYLTPAFALSGIIPTSTPLYDNMSPSELEAFLAEMDPDIRAADRDLREIEMLEKKGVTAANKLPEYQRLQPRLNSILQASAENRRKHVELEKRIAKVMNQYATTVRTIMYFLLQSIDSFCRRIHYLSCLLPGTTPCTTQRVKWQDSLVSERRGDDSA